jgi:hypothetical protein
MPARRPGAPTLHRILRAQLNGHRKTSGVHRTSCRTCDTYIRTKAFLYISITNTSQTWTYQEYATDLEKAEVDGGRHGNCGNFACRHSSGKGNETRRVLPGTGKQTGTSIALGTSSVYCSAGYKRSVEQTKEAGLRGLPLLNNAAVVRLISCGWNGQERAAV